MFVKRNFFHTLKAHIMTITVSFTLILTVLTASVSFSLSQSYARRNLVQSTEFNLQLVSGVIAQDLSSLDTLAKWCGNNSQILSYLSCPNPSPRETLSAYKRFNEEYQNNRARVYIQRLIVTDATHSRIFQVGSATSISNPVTVYNIDRLFQNRKGSAAAWESIERDPYGPKGSAYSGVITVFRPVLHPTTRKAIGYVYLAASTELITDPLSGYHAAEDSNLFAALGNHLYKINGGIFTEMQKPRSGNTALESAMTLDAKTQVRSVALQDGMTGTVVSYPVQNTGISLMNSLSEQELSRQKMVFLRVVLLICVSLLLLGLVLTVLLSRLINTPVAKIRRRLDRIAKGDFSADPEIEWNNEFGDVGRGINRLSLNVAGLMNRRIEDEKKKKDLEYQMLQSQINPHFLYNTLDSIKWMATIQNASGIAEMTTALARLLKSVAKGTRKVIPLREEISLLDNYFLIQQYRYGGAITLKKDLDENLLDNVILRFTLQPLLENAIFHGIEPKGGAGNIRVAARLQDEKTVEVSVEDDGVGMDETAIRKIFADENENTSGLFRQIGIRNVHRRIQYEFGEQYGLTITGKPGVFTRASVLLPRRSCIS